MKNISRNQAGRIFVLCLLQIFFQNHFVFCQGINPDSSESKFEFGENGIDEVNNQIILMTQDPALGYPPSERLEAVRTLLSNQGSNSISSTCMTWNERGPGNVGGRTRAIMYDPNFPTTKVWAGGVSGGLWVTKNITSPIVDWEKVNDFWDDLAISAIAYDPSNHDIFYVGTGEGYNNPDAVIGGGIWKTTDAGNHWTRIPSTVPASIYSIWAFIEKIVVDAQGDVFVGTRYGGVQEFRNGGTSWSQVLGSSIQVTNALGPILPFYPNYDEVADLEIASNGTIYAALGIYFSEGIYRSSNNGVSWEKISDSNTPLCGFATVGTYNRIEIACAPSNPQVIYAFLVNKNPPYIGNILSVYQSIDGGTHWILKSLPGGNDQAWYDLAVSVDPNDENTVYANDQVALYRSINACST